MIRCRYFLVAALLSSTSAVAAGNVTLTDQNGQYLGTQVNPLWVTGISGGGGGGAVYGTDATGAAPSKPPLFIAGVDGNGKIVPFTITANGLQFFATSLPLPTGAATAANQTSVQSAPGTSAGTAITIQGASPGVPVRVVANSGDIPISGQYLSSQVTATNGQILAVQLDRHLHIANTEIGSDDPLVGITPQVATSGTFLSGKPAAGNLYSAYATNLTTLAGYLVLINSASTTAPTSGATIAPVECIPLAASPTGNAGQSYGAGPPDAYTTGIAALLSTSCTTYTPSTMSGFIKVRAR